MIPYLLRSHLWWLAKEVDKEQDFLNCYNNYVDALMLPNAVFSMCIVNIADSKILTLRASIFNVCLKLLDYQKFLQVHSFPYYTDLPYTKWKVSIRQYIMPAHQAITYIEAKTCKSVEEWLERHKEWRERNTLIYWKWFNWC